MRFFDEYLEEVVNLYKIKYAKTILSDEEMSSLKQKVEALIKEDYKGASIKVANTVVREEQDSVRETDFLTLYDKCREDGHVFSLSHAVYKADDSLFLTDWDRLKSKRDEAKNQMKEALKAENYLKAYTLNGIQNARKKIANSTYGCCGEKSFMFYNVDSVSNITGTCFYVLLHTINQIEKSLGNRVILRTYSEAIEYVSYLLNKEIELEDNEETNKIVSEIISKLSIDDVDFIIEEFKNYYVKEFTDEDLTMFRNLLNKIFEEDKIRFAIFKYNCRLVKLNEDINFVDKMITEDLSNYISDKFDEKAFHKKFHYMVKVLNTFAYDDFLQSDVKDLCDNYVRKVVMLTDTDSTFCVATELFTSISNSICRILESENMEFSDKNTLQVDTFKMIMFIGATMSNKFLVKIAGPNVQNSQDNRWVLKSEFLYNRILLFKVKKKYFGSILSQEGIRLNPMKFDNKNTELIRSSYSYFVKDFTNEVFRYIVMGENSSTIGIFNVIDEYTKKFYEDIEDIKKLSMMGTRSEFKPDSNYVDPYGYYGFKAAALYNALFPESKIYPGNKTRLFNTVVFDIPKFELLKDRDKTIASLQIEQTEEFENKFKRSKVSKEEKMNIISFIEFLEKNEFENLINNKTAYEKLLKEVDSYSKDETIKWIIDTYGMNDELRRRFINLFENKKENKELIEKLVSDGQISYIAIDNSSTMPECLRSLIDIGQLKLSSIDNRVYSILEALGYKIIKKPDVKKSIPSTFLSI